MTLASHGTLSSLATRDASFGRRLDWAERETRFLDAWHSVVMQGDDWLTAAIQQGWRDVGRGGMSCGPGEAGWWECLRVVRGDESAWQQLCSTVWQRVSLTPAARVMISAAGNETQARNLSSQMLARIMVAAPDAR